MERPRRAVVFAEGAVPNAFQGMGLFSNWSTLSSGGRVIDAGAAGVVSYLCSFGEGVTLNRGDENPGTDSGRQATSCEPTAASTLG